MKELDDKEAMGADEASGYNLKCNQEMAESIYDVTDCSLKTGSPKEWKRADTMPIFKK